MGKGIEFDIPKLRIPMRDTEASTHDRLQQAKSLLPKSREAYSLVRIAIMHESSARRSRTVIDEVLGKAAIEKLYRDDIVDGVLEPPLTPELSEAVEACYLAQLNDVPDNRIVETHIAYHLLNAVYEHGYRSDGG